MTRTTSILRPATLAALLTALALALTACGGGGGGSKSKGVDTAALFRSVSAVARAQDEERTNSFPTDGRRCKQGPDELHYTCALHPGGVGTEDLSVTVTLDANRVDWSASTQSGATFTGSLTG